MDCGVHFHSIMGLCHTRNQKSNSIERKINDKRKVVEKFKTNKNSFFILFVLTSNCKSIDLIDNYGC